MQELGYYCTFVSAREGWEAEGAKLRGHGDIG